MYLCGAIWRGLQIKVPSEIKRILLKFLNKLSVSVLVFCCVEWGGFLFNEASKSDSAASHHV